ncbi:hypothetical protein MNBD_NITROSPINAE01-1813 [hydrothermal vent metagenome]|uniref:NFACT RNA-binding domain-containing protein n=1 Tax=hydrothermal vent metagenome TaxID=652676 RepID=A0A3B1BXG7_9ZZZZ
MNLTVTEISRVISELSQNIEGAFLNKVWGLAEDEWAVELRQGGKKLWLAISISPSNSRMHLLTDAPDRKTEPSHFTKMFKKAASRSPLRKILQVNADRIVRLDFIGSALIAELMGPKGNLYLLGEEDRIVAVALARKSHNRPGEIYTPPSKPPANAGAVKIEAEQKPGLSFNMELAERYGEIVRLDILNRAKQKALAPLKVQLKKTAKRKKGLDKEKRELEKHSNDRHLGDILQANFTALKKGLSSITAIDFYDAEAKEINITLNPALSPAENVKRYYKWSKKHEKGIPRIENELKNLIDNEKTIAEKVKKIESTDKIEDIEQSQQAKPNQQKTGKKGKTAYSGPRRFITSDGYTALVGRSDRENDEITFKKSNGRDLWLHARDYPGSHVVVKLPKGLKQIPKTTLAEAAMLALNYSKAAKAGKGEVTYCYVKEIRKPKGAPAGKVLVTGAKSVMARIDSETIKTMKIRVSE